MHSEAPNSIAFSNLNEFTSIPTILLQPNFLAAYMTDKPTAPSPKTATEEPD
jgi:hypothetical protein